MNYSELRKLFSARTENLVVEYKRQVPEPTDLRKDVTAMANSMGGLLCIGVDEGKNNQPVFSGVEPNRHTNSRDRIIGILAENIDPKIPGLNIELVEKTKARVMFVIRVPHTPFVHGVKSDGWHYFIRRSGRVDEMAPSELQQLANLKNDYKANMKTRATLLETAYSVRREFARLLDLTDHGLEPCLADAKKLDDAVRRAKAKNVCENYVDAFYDLKRGISYALKIPHAKLSVEEQEVLQELKEATDNYAQGVNTRSSMEILSVDEAPEFEYLSAVAWVKYAMKETRDGNTEQLWGGLVPLFSSYGITFKELVNELKARGIPFSKFYEESFTEHLQMALKDTVKVLDKLAGLIESFHELYGF